MKKLIIFGAGGFVAALVVSTLIRVLTAPPLPPVVAPVVESAGAPGTPATQTPSGHAESPAAMLAEGSKPEDAARVPDGAMNPEGTKAPVGAMEPEGSKAPDGAMNPEGLKAPDAAVKVETPPAGQPELAARSEETIKTAPPVAQPAVASGTAKARDGKELKLLAKILTNMKPADAAKVLKDLPDEQVQRLIVAMGARSAATVLAQLPPERAAALSRRLLEDPESETP